MIDNNPPTLRELLAHRSKTDESNINVSKHNYKEPNKPKTIYQRTINEIPEYVLNLKIVAWLRRDGIYIAE